MSRPLVYRHDPSRYSTVHLAFYIFTGIGIAAAVGIRPFLPALLAGVLAAGNVELTFSHTDYSFLQSVPFLLAMVVLAILTAIAERRLGPTRVEGRSFTLVLAALGAVLGALFFAGSLVRGHYAAWPGWFGGVICVVIAALATRPLFARVRARLDPEAAAAVPLYAEFLGVALAGLAIVAPPIGLIGLILLLWLIAASRRREGQKYAGLRILR